VSASISVDGVAVRGPTPVGRGLHFISIDAVLAGDRWMLVPRWNGQEIWTHATTTVRRPSSFDLAARPWVRWIPTLAAIALLGLWLLSAMTTIGGGTVLAWTIAASALIAWLVQTDRVWIARWPSPVWLGRR